MLGIALGAIVIACLLMTILFSKYSFSTKVSGLTAPKRAATLEPGTGALNSELSRGSVA
jgi:hypothetical protein